MDFDSQTENYNQSHKNALSHHADRALAEIQAFGLDNALQMKPPGVGAFLAQFPDDSDLTRQRTYLLQLCDDNREQSLTDFRAAELERVPSEIKRRITFAHLHFIYRSRGLRVSELANAAGLDSTEKLEKLHNKGYRLQKFFAEYPEVYSSTMKKTGDIAGAYSLTSFRNISAIDAILGLESVDLRHDLMFNPPVCMPIDGTKVPCKLADLTATEIKKLIPLLNKGKLTFEELTTGKPVSPDDSKDTPGEPEQNSHPSSSESKDDDYESDSDEDDGIESSEQKIAHLRRAFAALKGFRKKLKDHPERHSLHFRSGVCHLQHLLTGIAVLTEPEGIYYDL